MAFGMGAASLAGPQDDAGLNLSPDMLASLRAMMLAPQPSADPASGSAGGAQAGGMPLGFSTVGYQQPVVAPAQGAAVPSAAASVTLPTISADVPQQQAETGKTTDQQALIASAQRLGLSPVEWGGIIHYESGGDPSRWGGAKNPDGTPRHVGLIQFGPDEQRQFGVTGKESFQDQLPKAEAFLLARGYKPGSGVMNAYSTINAGSPGHFNAYDAGNGGMPGTVADKVNTQFAPHYAWANKFLGGGMQLPSSAAGSNAPAAFGFSGPTQAGGSGTVLPAGGGSMETPAAAASDDTGSSAADAMRGLSGMSGGNAGKGAQAQPKGPPALTFRPVQRHPFSFMTFAGQRSKPTTTHKPHTGRPA